MMGYEEILQIASVVRLTLERVEVINPVYERNLWVNFPVGSCKASAHLLMYYLDITLNIPQDEMLLYANAEFNSGLHAWACVSGFHVDITADQFGGAPVIVSPESPWPNCTNGPDEYAYSGLVVAPDFIEEYYLICEVIERNREAYL